MRFFLTFSAALLATTCLAIPARAQCAGGLITNCPPAVSPAPTDQLLLWQQAQNPHTRSITITGLGSASGTTPQVNVLTFGADPTGVADSSAAFAAAGAAAASVVSGVPRCVYDPAGTYLIAANALSNIGCLEGDTMWTSKLSVTQSFNP